MLSKTVLIAVNDIQMWTYIFLNLGYFLGIQVYKAQVLYSHVQAEAARMNNKPENG